MDDTVAVLVGAAMGALFLVPASLKPNVARGLIALTFFAGTLFNSIFTFADRGWVLESMVAGPYVPGPIRDVTLALVVPNATAFVLLLVLFQLSVGSLVLSKGMPVKLALLAAIPFLGTMWLTAPEGALIATALAQLGATLGCALMLRLRFDSSLPALIVGRLRAAGGGSAECSA